MEARSYSESNNVIVRLVVARLGKLRRLMRVLLVVETLRDGSRHEARSIRCETGDHGYGAVLRG